MRIIIDINHPAHVHYYRNFIKIMEQRGHKFLIISRNKEIEHNLLNHYQIPFVDKGNGSKNLFGKFFYYFYSVWVIFKNALLFKPDLLIGSPYSALASRLLLRPHICFGDTDHAILTQKLTMPFNDYMLTPSCFKRNLGRTHLRFKGYLELCYLHHNYFTPDKKVLELLGVKENERYVILRFVSFNAQHDIGHSGIDSELKMEIINTLEKSYKVFISSESPLPVHFKKYHINIPPERIHDALYFSSYYIGEGATMASESVLLGTPAIYVNSLTAGTLNEQADYGLLFEFRDKNGVIEKVRELAENHLLKDQLKQNHKKMIDDKIDVTAFMVWFVENYPKSAGQMKSDSVKIEKMFLG